MILKISFYTLFENIFLCQYDPKGNAGKNEHHANMAEDLDLILASMAETLNDVKCRVGVLEGVKSGGSVGDPEVVSTND